MTGDLFDIFKLLVRNEGDDFIRKQEVISFAGKDFEALENAYKEKISDVQIETAKRILRKILKLGSLKEASCQTDFAEDD